MMLDYRGRWSDHPAVVECRRLEGLFGDHRGGCGCVGCSDLARARISAGMVYVQLRYGVGPDDARWSPDGEDTP